MSAGTTAFARAKINLSLEVLGRRSDSYHELRSIVAFADIGDRISLVAAPANRLEVLGPFAGAVPRDEHNLIWKAWGHLASLRPVPKVHVRLEKNLPVASGLGGGSADAAAMLHALLQLTGQKLDEDQLRGLATIGADVPVCFLGKTCVMEGIGEKLSPLQLDVPPALVLVNPGVACATSSVFRAMRLAPVSSLPPVLESLWRNDLTTAAITVQPIIADVLRALHSTALYSVMMSGSGATCFGVAQSYEAAQAEARKLASLHPQWWVRASTVE